VSGLYLFAFALLHTYRSAYAHFFVAIVHIDAIGNRLKEASMINKSLLCLGHVINALVDKEHGKARHIPFRNSKLTFLLKDTWGGNSKTCLVATVSPSGSSQSETITTLTFAQRAKLIKNNAILNEDTCGTVAALQAEVAKLRTKLQESSSTIVERIVESEITTKNDEVILSMKRRSERAEIRVAELEKQISDEAEIVNTLKRKVQEETMVRKFKERRLDYMQRKDTGKCTKINIWVILFFFSQQSFVHAITSLQLLMTEVMIKSNC
jgi:kinesin family protein 15